jgi:lipid-A-disaccharide synthase
MIVVYRASRTSFAIGRRLVRVPWISLVNIVAGERIVPELLQGQVTPERLEREAEMLLDSPELAERMRRGFDRVARELGPPGASERAAEAVIEGVEGRAPARGRAATR